MLIALLLVLVVVVAGSLFFAFSGKTEAGKRLALVKQEGDKDVSVEELITKRRKNVQSALKRIEDKQTHKQKKRMTLRQRLDQAGYAEAPVRNFWVISAVLGGMALAINILSGETLLITVLTSFVAGLGLPHWGLGWLQKRRRKKFTDDFASAMDVIVRSVRSGLPSFDALKLVGTEFRDPVGGEFKRLIEDVRLGLTMEQALQRMFDRMPTPEVGFFSVVMAVQYKSGGNLAEALNNLASVLRDRKRLEGKIRAMSAEAKSTAGIIGSLPIVVMGMLYLTTPSYIMMLFDRHTGNLILGGCVLWMGIGIFVMRQMINFKH